MRIARMILAATLIVGVSTGADAVRPGDSVPGGKRIVIRGPVKGPPVLTLCINSLNTTGTKPAICGGQKNESASPD